MQDKLFDTRFTDKPYPSLSQISQAPVKQPAGPAACAEGEIVPVNQTDFHHATPILENFPGWSEDISTARTFEDLPQTAQDYVLALEKMSGTRISVIGVGPARDAVIVRHDLLD